MLKVKFNALEQAILAQLYLFGIFLENKYQFFSFKSYYWYLQMYVQNQAKGYLQPLNVHQHEGFPLNIALNDK